MNSKKVILIVATGKNQEIGKNNDLLWHLPKDMAFFRRTTTGNIVITGRKNYESIPEKYRPLKERENIIITRQNNYEAPGAHVVHSVSEALELSQGLPGDIFIIGGGMIYKSFLEEGLVDEMLITHVDEEFDADVYFPQVKLENWKSACLAHFKVDDKHLYNFQINHYTKDPK